MNRRGDGSLRPHAVYATTSVMAAEPTDPSAKPFAGGAVHLRRIGIHVLEAIGMAETIDVGVRKQMWEQHDRFTVKAKTTPGLPVSSPFPSHSAEVPARRADAAGSYRRTDGYGTIRAELQGPVRTLP